MKKTGIFIILAMGLVFAGCTGGQAASRTSAGEEMITAQALYQRIKDGEDIQLVDVREATELADIPLMEGAIHIPLDELAARKGELNKDEELVILCRSGRRSKLAHKELAQAGFTSLVVLDGGMLAWLEEIEKEHSTP